MTNRPVNKQKSSNVYTQILKNNKSRKKKSDKKIKKRVKVEK